MSAHDAHIDERDLRDVTALADGTLRGRRREAVEARVRARPELAALLAEQETAVDALRAIDVAAPARLRVALAGAGTSRHPRRQRGRALAIGLAGAAAAAAAVVVLVLPSGTPWRAERRAGRRPWRQARHGGRARARRRASRGTCGAPSRVSRSPTGARGSVGAPWQPASTACTGAAP